MLWSQDGSTNMPTFHSSDSGDGSGYVTGIFTVVCKVYKRQHLGYLLLKTSN